MGCVKLESTTRYQTRHIGGVKIGQLEWYQREVFFRCSIILGWEKWYRWGKVCIPINKEVCKIHRGGMRGGLWCFNFCWRSLIIGPHTWMYIFGSIRGGVQGATTNIQTNRGNRNRGGVVHFRLKSIMYSCLSKLFSLVNSNRNNQHKHPEL